MTKTAIDLAREELLARAKAAENMLLRFTPNGSEYFKRDGDGFRVDIESCARFIQEQRESAHRAKCEREILRRDLIKLQSTCWSFCETLTRKDVDLDPIVKDELERFLTVLRESYSQ